MRNSNWREPTRRVLRGCQRFVTLNFPAGTNNKIVIGAENEAEQQVIYDNALRDINCSQVRKRKGQLPDYPNADTCNYIMKKDVLKGYVRPGEDEYENGDHFCAIRRDFGHLEYFREMYKPNARDGLEHFKEPLQELIRLMAAAGLTNGEIISISPVGGAILYRDLFTLKKLVSGDKRYGKGQEPEPLKLEDLGNGYVRVLEDEVDG